LKKSKTNLQRQRSESLDSNKAKKFERDNSKDKDEIALKNALKR